MTDKATIVINVPPEIKGAWVAASRAQGLKLTDWIVQRVGLLEYDFDGFSSNVPAFAPFERYVRELPDDDARDLFKRVRALDARQDDAISAIKIARMYLEKRVALADGVADHDLFHDINVDALGLYAAAPDLTHLDLIGVIVTAQNAA